jgi:hypothetical protein
VRLYQRLLGDARAARDEAQALARHTRVETEAIRRLARESPPRVSDELAENIRATWLWR